MSTELHTRALKMAEAPWAYSGSTLTALIGELIAAAAKAEADLKSVLDRESETHRRHDTKLDKLEAEIARLTILNAASGVSGYGVSGA